MNQNPNAETVNDKWSYRHIEKNVNLPKTMEEFDDAEPLFVDVLFPVEDNTYRYLKIIVHQTFETKPHPVAMPNTNKYITLHELEVFVKKN